jgi:protein-S-isoprenylcysteine O-methyltransferase Ste14
MLSETVFRLITIVLVLTGAGIGFYHRIKAHKLSQEKINRQEEGNFILIGLRLSGGLVWASTLAYMINPAWMAWASLPLPAWLRWAGVGGALAAIPLLYWMFTSLGKNITDTVVTRQEHTLVIHGPYRWVRHPLYSFAALFFLSLSLIAANWFIAAMIGLTFLMIAIRTPIEEAKLVERFGDDYRAYMQRTGRFLPYRAILNRYSEETMC